MAVIGVAAAGTYFWPLLSQANDAERTVFQEYGSGKRYTGQTGFSDRMSYSATVPAVPTSGDYVQNLGFKFRVEKHVGDEGTALVSVNITYRDTTAHRLIFWFEQTDGFAEQPAYLDPMRIDCPCEAEPITFLVDFKTTRVTGQPYDYSFTPIWAYRFLQPADGDHDLIADSEQWIPGVPQYLFSLALIGVAALVSRYV